MKLEQLIFQIRKKGCDVIVINEATIPNEECDGLFTLVKDKPTIKLAYGSKTQTRLRYILMHEYAHYLQWIDGFMPQLDGIVDSWVVFDAWLAGKKFSRKKLARARNAMLLLEYDADVRVLEIAKDFGVKLSKRRHIREANSYAALIKWAFENRQWSALPHEYYFLPTLQDPNTLLGPLDDRSNAAFNADVLL